MMQHNHATSKQLLHYIDMVSFAELEACLFLDTHPKCQEAMHYFKHHQECRKKALKEFAERFYPLTLDTAASCEDKWKWVYSKWPWEGGDC